MTFKEILIKEIEALEGLPISNDEIDEEIDDRLNCAYLKLMNLEEAQNE